MPEPRLSDEERQRISFAYGNVSLHNPNITREMVEEEARKMSDAAKYSEDTCARIEMVLNDPGCNITPVVGCVLGRALEELRSLRAEQAEPFSAELAALRERFPTRSIKVGVEMAALSQQPYCYVMVGERWFVEPTLTAAMRHFISDWKGGDDE